jgi:hypothetical protein
LRVGAKEIALALCIAWTHTQRVNICTWAVNAQTVGAECVDIGVCIFDWLAMAVGDASNPCLDYGVESAQNFLAQLRFRMGLVQSFRSEILQTKL